MESDTIDQKRLEEIEREQRELLDLDSDSLDEDGYSKGDPYAATAK